MSIEFNIAQVQETFLTLKVLAAIGEASPDMMFAKDLNGRYLFINRVAAETIGTTVEEAIGKRDIDFLAPEMIEKVREMDVMVLGYRAPVTLEQTIGTPTGDRIFVTTRRPLFDGSEIVGIVGTSREVTEQRRAETVLREQNARYEAVLASEAKISNFRGDYQSLLEVILQTVREVTQADGASLEVAEGDEMVYEAGTGLAAPFKGLRIGRYTSLSGMTLRDGEPTRSDDTEEDVRVDREACRKIGLRSMLLMPLRYGDQGLGVLKVMSRRAYAFDSNAQHALGMLRGFLGATIGMKRAEHGLLRSEERLSELVHDRTRDLRTANTKLVEARDAALAASVAKSQFLANMSHEIRTPLNGVIGMTSLLLEQTQEENQRKSLETIEASGHTLMRVLDDVLDLSKIEAGKLDFDPADTDLRQVVRDVVALYQGEATRRHIRLHIGEPTGTCPRILTDAMRLRQILSNLISNALKFTPEGEVGVNWTCEATNEGVMASFEVRDTGLGIPPERLDAIFESFTQVDGSVQRRFGGTGLGLTICRRLTEMMGGKISVSSRLNEGSTFRVELPFALSETLANAQAVEPGEEAPPLGYHVLVAEDNDVNVLIAEALLESLGCTVDIVGDGSVAIAQALSADYDLILMDLQMPVCDGIEATRVIRSEEVARGLPRRPIYALTASAMARDREECFNAGMDGLLSKPITLSSLRAFFRDFRPER